MFPKIRSNMNFTSNVNKIDKYMGGAFDLYNFDKKDLIELDKAIKQLQLNGNDDFVTIFPKLVEDGTNVGVQVIKNENIGKKFVDTLVGIFADDITEAYKFASEHMIPIKK